MMLQQFTHSRFLEQNYAFPSVAWGILAVLVLRIIGGPVLAQDSTIQLGSADSSTLLSIQHNYEDREQGVLCFIDSEELRDWEAEMFCYYFREDKEPEWDYTPDTGENPESTKKVLKERGFPNVVIDSTVSKVKSADTSEVVSVGDVSEGWDAQIDTLSRDQVKSDVFEKFYEISHVTLASRLQNTRGLERAYSVRDSLQAEIDESVLTSSLKNEGPFGLLVPFWFLIPALFLGGLGFYAIHSISQSALAEMLLGTEEQFTEEVAETYKSPDSKASESTFEIPERLKKEVEDISEAHEEETVASYVEVFLDALDQSLNEITGEDQAASELVLERLKQLERRKRSSQTEEGDSLDYGTETSGAQDSRTSTHETTTGPDGPSSGSEVSEETSEIPLRLKQEVNHSGEVPEKEEMTSYVRAFRDALHQSLDGFAGGHEVTERQTMLVMERLDRFEEKLSPRTEEGDSSEHDTEWDARERSGSVPDTDRSKQLDDLANDYDDLTEAYDDLADSYKDLADTLPAHQHLTDALADEPQYDQKQAEQFLIELLDLYEFVSEALVPRSSSGLGESSEALKSLLDSIIKLIERERTEEDIDKESQSKMERAVRKATNKLIDTEEENEKLNSEIKKMTSWAKDITGNISKKNSIILQRSRNFVDKALKAASGNSDIGTLEQLVERVKELKSKAEKKEKREKENKKLKKEVGHLNEEIDTSEEIINIIVENTELGKIDKDKNNWKEGLSKSINGFKEVHWQIILGVSSALVAFKRAESEIEEKNEVSDVLRIEEIKSSIKKLANQVGEDRDVQEIIFDGFAKGWLHKTFRAKALSDMYFQNDIPKIKDAIDQAEAVMRTILHRVNGDYETVELLKAPDEGEDLETEMKGGSTLLSLPGVKEKVKRATEKEGNVVFDVRLFPHQKGGKRNPGKVIVSYPAKFG